MRKLSGGGDIYFMQNDEFYYCFLSTPSPLRGTHPCPRGRKWMLGYCRNTMNIFTPPADCPPETGGRGVKRRRGWTKPLATTYYFSTPSPLRGTHPCLRGRKWMLGHCRNTMNIFTPPAGCPPETGGRAHRAEGVDKTALYYLNLSTPSPLRGTHPCLRGRKWVLEYCKNTKSPFSCCNYSPLLQRG